MSRLMMEDDKVCVYHNLENSQMLHGSELQCIEVEPPVSRSSILHCTQSHDHSLLPHTLSVFEAVVWKFDTFGCFHFSG